MKRISFSSIFEPVEISNLGENFVVFQVSHENSYILINIRDGSTTSLKNDVEYGCSFNNVIYQVKTEFVTLFPTHELFTKFCRYIEQDVKIHLNSTSSESFYKIIKNSSSYLNAYNILLNCLYIDIPFVDDEVDFAKM